MKLKPLILASTAIAAWVLASCGGGSSTSSGVTKESLFGEIPGLYEEMALDMIEEMKSIKEKGNDDLSAAMKALTGITENLEKLQQECQPIADKMKGRSLPYVLSDSLPYEIISDVKVTEAKLPVVDLLSSHDKGVCLDVAFDAVLKPGADKKVTFYYLIMADDKAMECDETRRMQRSATGDTLHVRTTIEAPDAPAKYVNKCNLLKFVTKEAYQAEQDGIHALRKQWNKEFDEMAGKQ